MYTSPIEIWTATVAADTTALQCRIGVQGIGQLHMITVAQELDDPEEDTAELEGFDVEVYDDMRACPPNTTATSPDAATTLPDAFEGLAHNAAHHLVCPKFSAAAAATVAQVFEPSAWVYRNTEVTVANRIDADYLYFKITPTANPVGKTFTISVRAAQPGA